MTSVLTFILLVVLGGGVGLVVVSLAESPKPTAETPRSERGPVSDEPSTVDDEPADEHPEPVVVVPAPAPAGGPEFGAAPEPMRRRTSVGAVPRSRIAVEGRFDDVARAPVWRRLLAVAGILAITVAAGVAVAAILAAVIGAAAELVGNTIG